MARLVLCLLVCVLGSFASNQATKSQTGQVAEGKQISLGKFSVSLAVKDLAASRAFYEKLGFRSVSGNPAKNWIVLENDTSTIGLFQGMFAKNMMTFNPGWDRTRATLPDFDDVREIQKALTSRGLELTTKADESTTGPASLMLNDPDGNPILVDQYVPSPKRK